MKFKIGDRVVKICGTFLDDTPFCYEGEITSIEESPIEHYILDNKYFVYEYQIDLIKK